MADQDKTQGAKSSWKSTTIEYGKSILIAIVLALIIRAYVVQAFVIPSGSMEDTLEIGDHILVNKFIYGTKIPFTDDRVLKVREPRRGDVIVFEYPKEREKDYIKRIIGVPGDEIRIADKKVFVNGKEYDNPHAVHKEKFMIPPGENPRDNMAPILVPPGRYFVMGDNRDRSSDSRYWGWVHKDDIKGLAFMKYWSWDKEKRWVRWRSIGDTID